MVELRNQGRTLQEVGFEFQLSRERVRQILQKAGYVGKPDLPPVSQMAYSVEEQKAKARQRSARWYARKTMQAIEAHEIVGRKAT